MDTQSSESNPRETAQRLPIHVRIQAAATASTVAAFVVRSMREHKDESASAPAVLVKAIVDDASVGIQRCIAGSSFSGLRHRTIATMLGVVAAGAELASTMPGSGGK